MIENNDDNWLSDSKLTNVLHVHRCPACGHHFLGHQGRVKCRSCVKSMLDLREELLEYGC